MIDPVTTGAKSALISGSAWDTTLQWMVKASDNKDKEPNLGYDENSEGKGVYNSELTTTGQYAVNNIYDMAGNIWEFTTEFGVSGPFNLLIDRGGGYNSSGIDCPASHRTSHTGYTGGFSNDIGMRVVLYK